MIFHGENDVQNINSKVIVDWNITPESIDEPETLSESYHAILSFQDFTDFFGDLVEKQRKIMTANKYNADKKKYLGDFVKTKWINLLTLAFQRLICCMSKPKTIFMHQSVSPWLILIETWFMVRSLIINTLL